MAGTVFRRMRLCRRPLRAPPPGSRLRAGSAGGLRPGGQEADTVHLAKELLATERHVSTQSAAIGVVGSVAAKLGAVNEAAAQLAATRVTVVQSVGQMQQAAPIPYPLPRCRRWRCRCRGLPSPLPHVFVRALTGHSCIASAVALLAANLHRHTSAQLHDACASTRLAIV